MADATERANSVFITGLKNAHALENQALELMNRQVERIENYPDIKARLQQHIQETHDQIARLERVLESLGESRSVLKDNALSLTGNMAAITQLSRRTRSSRTRSRISRSRISRSPLIVAHSACR